MSEVTIYEVGPRDGLQNEARIIPASDKIQLIDLLSATGLGRIEATSFVSPKWVPQMADAEAVMDGILRKPALRGTHAYERAKQAKADEVAVFASASESFSQKNINCSIAESIERFRPVAEAARADGIEVRGYVSCVVACPYSGPVPPAEVARVVELLFDLGCYEVSLGDTIGAGTPQTIEAMLDTVMVTVSPERLAGHYHDTGGNAVANVLASMERGLSTFDCAVGGLGGCPYAPGAKGNVATGLVVDELQARGVSSGIHRDALRQAEAFVAKLTGTS